LKHAVGTQYAQGHMEKAERIEHVILWNRVKFLAVLLSACGATLQKLF